MNRSRREAELEALYGDRYPAVLVSQMGGRKRDRKKLLQDQMYKSFQAQAQTPQTQVPQPFQGYELGTLPSYQMGTLDPVEQQRFEEGVRRRQQQTVNPTAPASAPGASPGAGGVPPAPIPGAPPATPGAPATVPGTTPGTDVEATSQNPSIPNKPWWWLRMREKVEGANPYAKNEATRARAQEQMTAGKHTFKTMPTGPRRPVTPPAPAPVPPGPGPAPLPTNPITAPMLPSPPRPLGMETGLALGTLPSYEGGSLVELIGSGLSKSRGVQKSAAVPPGMDERLSLLYRQVMNSPTTLAGLGVGLARGAEFGPGPAGSIHASFDDPSGLTDPQALGDVMLIPKRYGKNEKIKTHELGHVRQGRFFGPLLPAASALGVLGGYEQSPFEQKALEMGELEKALLAQK